MIKAPEEVESLHYFVYFVKWLKVFKSLAKFNLHNSRKMCRIENHLFSHLRWRDQIFLGAIPLKFDVQT